MKKFFSLILSVGIILGMTTITHAKTGDVLGYAKYTDISAYINHYPITSYNIKDYTAVVAEDLRNYGFNVTWDGNTRSLSITKNPSATKITSYGTVYKYSSKAGHNSFPYLETDITTYVNGTKVDSFNIDGKTCVYMESLAPYGEVVWLPETRAIKMWIDGLPITDYAPISEFNTSTNSQHTVSSYYPGTSIPTYTSVTGVSLKRQDSLSDGTPVYMYNYTNSDDLGDYWKKLIYDGWRSFKSDDESTFDTFESYYRKGSDVIIINIYFDNDEVWITYG